MRTSRGRASREETADEKLDRLLEEDRQRKAQARAQSERPEVRSVRVGRAGGDGSGQERQPPQRSGDQLALTGLSPEQQRWLISTANSMRNEPARPSFLPPPLPVEQRVGGEGLMAGGNGMGQGDLLGPLGSPVVLRPLPPGRVEGAGGELRLLDGQSGRESGAQRHLGGQGDSGKGHLQRPAGKGHGGATAREASGDSRGLRSREVSVNLFPDGEGGRRMPRTEPPAMSASPAPTMVMGDEMNPFSAGINPFWSEGVRRQVMDGIEEKDEKKEDTIEGPALGAGLTKTDIEELEKIKREGLREIEQRMIEEVKKRSEGSSASYRTLPTGQELEIGRGATEGGRSGRLGCADTPLQTPPGIQNGWGLEGQRPQGEALTESLRSLELPKLGAGTSPVSFGDLLLAP